MTIDQVDAWVIILVVLVVAILAHMVMAIVTQVEMGKTKRLKERRKILALQVRQAELAQGLNDEEHTEQPETGVNNDDDHTTGNHA